MNIRRAPGECPKCHQHARLVIGWGDSPICEACIANDFSTHNAPVYVNTKTRRGCAGCVTGRDPYCPYCGGGAKMGRGTG